MAKFTKKQRLEMFSEEIGLIKNDKYRNFLEDVLDAADDYFFDMPASTTGKYHPSFALGDGGLVRHTRAVVFVARCIGEAHMYDDELMDMLTVAAITHDIKKKGNDGSQFTAKEHPQCAVKLLTDVYSKKNYGIKDVYVMEICGAVESHMGQWGDRKPVTEFEKILHSADYIASRKQFSYTVFSDNFSKNPQPHPSFFGDSSVVNVPMNVESFVFPWGKHVGKKLNEIADTDMGYLTWIANNADFNDKNVQNLVKEFLSKK